MNDKWLQSAKDMNKKELKRNITWCSGYILDLRKNICSLEQQVDMKKIKIMELKEDMKELDALLGDRE